MVGCTACYLCNCQPYQPQNFHRVPAGSFVFPMVTHILNCSSNVPMLKIGEHISYHIISYHIISYHIISYHIISYHIISCHVMSCRVMSCHITSYNIIYHIISYHISYHIFCRELVCIMVKWTWYNGRDIFFHITSGRINTWKGVNQLKELFFLNSIVIF